jgi:shikimate kinase
VAFRDTDADIVEAGRQADRRGLHRRRRGALPGLEQAAVVTALTEHDGVLSLGGGAVLSESTRAALAGHRVALLEVDLAHATGRVGLNRDRPVLALNPRAQLKALLEQRMPLYREVADLTVDTNDRTPTEVVQELAEQLVRLQQR